eukprot:COSAG01_NODE_6913_length_3441_cov_8.635357_3_plen_118_part_00
MPLVGVEPRLARRHAQDLVSPSSLVASWLARVRVRGRAANTCISAGESTSPKRSHVRVNALMSTRLEPERLKYLASAAGPPRQHRACRHRQAKHSNTQASEVKHSNTLEATVLHMLA